MSFLKDEEGVTAIEYALIAAVIATSIAITVFSVGIQLNTFFSNVVSALTQS